MLERVFLIFLTVVVVSWAQLKLNRFANGMDNLAGMRLLKDGRILALEKCGNIRVITADHVLLTAPMLTIPKASLDCSGDRGLLGLAEDPSFDTNRFIYVYYTSPTNYVHMRVSRFTVSGNLADLSSEVILLESDRADNTGNHYGGQIEFGPDGCLYISTGDNNKEKYSQDLNSLLGKILRINSDGSIPASNPFRLSNGNPSPVWAYGLRNPFSMAFNFATNQFFINDVGYDSYEEVNIGLIGRNYGWPKCEGPCVPSNAAYTDPLYYYPHGPGCAITGGRFYYPQIANFPSVFVGKYFFNDLCRSQIYYIDPNNPGAMGSESLVIGGTYSPIGLEVDSAGNLLYVENGGGLGEIVGSAANGPFIVSQPADATIDPGSTATFTVEATSSETLSYQWQMNGINIPGAQSSSFTTAAVTSSDSGNYYCCLVLGITSGVVTRGAILTVSAAPPTIQPATVVTVSPTTVSPTTAETATPTQTPQTQPSAQLTVRPTTVKPTTAPVTVKPTIRPQTIKPSTQRTGSPTTVPVSATPTQTPRTTQPSTQRTVNPTTVSPTAAPVTATPTKRPQTTQPSIQRTVSPTTVSPTVAETATPTQTPQTTQPSARLTVSPTTVRPTTASVTAPPTNRPQTTQPSTQRTGSPTTVPVSATPTSATLSKAPSKAPSKTPTKAPSKTPTKASSKAPSKASSKAPSKASSKAPSKASSKGPSKAPSKAPTNCPTKRPITSVPTSFISSLPSSMRPSAASTLSLYPSIAPSIKPSSKMPTVVLSKALNQAPNSAKPSSLPSKPPTAIPTAKPISSNPTNQSKASTAVKLICQNAAYCKKDSDCISGNKCFFQTAYYSQCIADPTTYSTAPTCLRNYGARCGASSVCCDPGAFCDQTKAFPQCQQPQGGSSLCVSPTAQ